MKTDKYEERMGKIKLEDSYLYQVISEERCPE
jgi:hypothetical protein